MPAKFILTLFFHHFLDTSDYDTDDDPNVKAAADMMKGVHFDDSSPEKSPRKKRATKKKSYLDEEEESDEDWEKVKKVKKRNEIEIIMPHLYVDRTSYNRGGRRERHFEVYVQQPSGFLLDPLKPSLSVDKMSLEIEQFSENFFDSMVLAGKKRADGGLVQDIEKKLVEMSNNYESRPINMMRIPLPLKGKEIIGNSSSTVNNQLFFRGKMRQVQWVCQNYTVLLDWDEGHKVKETANPFGDMDNFDSPQKPRRKSSKKAQRKSSSSRGRHSYRDDKKFSDSESDTDSDVMEEDDMTDDRKRSPPKRPKVQKVSDDGENNNSRGSLSSSLKRAFSGNNQE